MYEVEGDDHSEVASLSFPERVRNLRQLRGLAINMATKLLPKRPSTEMEAFTCEYTAQSTSMDSENPYCAYAPQAAARF